MHSELLGLLPPIRRIRGSRLYAQDGRRFLDLWMDDGRGILGERERNARLFALNALDKGLGRPYPGLYESRFRAAVQAAFPHWPAMRIYRNDDSLAAALVRLSGSQCKPLDTALPSSSHTGTVQTAILRPFAPDAPNAAFAIVRLPCSRAYSPAVLVARSESALRSEYNEAVPQAWLYAASRALDSLAQTNAAGSKDGYGPELWTRWDKRMAPYFNRTGPYLSPTAQALTHAGSYRAFFERALAGCALVSPSPDSPSVIPPDFDDGELTKLARALENGTSHA